MTSPKTRRFGFIMNPKSGNGNALRQWNILLPKVKELFGSNWTMIETSNPGDAKRLTYDMILEGYNVLVAVGGDGTINEIVNGYILAKGKEKGIELGVLPYGIFLFFYFFIFNLFSISN
jgi:diacylglycerol kinase family enzyme